MKVFLSHSSENKGLVREVYKLLSANNAWLDEVEIDIGDLIPEKISIGINESTHFVLFWSKAAAKSSWVKIELNAAFVSYCSEKCNLLVFPIDDCELPLILQPFKYDKVDCSDEKNAAQHIYEKIVAITTKSSSQSTFVNRTKEIGEIEDAKNSGKRLVIISGLSGIGKYALVLRAIEWLFSDKRSITIDLNFTSGIPEVCMKLASQLDQSIADDLSSVDSQKKYMTRMLEVASLKQTILVFRNAKNWLEDNGSPNPSLMRILGPVLNTPLFDKVPVFITSTRFVVLQNTNDNFIYAQNLRLGTLNERHISAIIKNNLSKSFLEEEFDCDKNLVLARSLSGYPLAARIAANLIMTDGYDYYISQPKYVQNLTASLARELVQYNKFSPECEVYLRLLALTKCSLRNDEICEAFPNLSKTRISNVAEEAYHAGIVTFEDGRYILEEIVQGYYFDAAFVDPGRKAAVHHLVEYLQKKLPKKANDDSQKYVRLIPCTIFLLMLDGQLSRATMLRKDMIATMLSSAWEQYKHREYREALSIALAIIENSDIDREEYEQAKRIQALCLLRNEEYAKVAEILRELRQEFGERYRYDYIDGRMQKAQENYRLALIFFKNAHKKNRQHVSSMREIAEIYFWQGDTKTALSYIKKANLVEQGNPFIAVLESKILAETGDIAGALRVLDNPALRGINSSLVNFQKGRICELVNRNAEARDYYKQALRLDPNELDAKLCLLNHDVSNGLDCGNEIELLKAITDGKKARILLNIEARYIGHVKNDLDGALNLLDTVPLFQRDRLWYAVKIQLCNRKIGIDSACGRKILADETHEVVCQMVDQYERRFSEKFETSKANYIEI